MNSELVFFEVKIPKGNEYTIEQTQVFLSNFVSSRKGLFASIFGSARQERLVLEIVSHQQKIHFIIGVSPTKAEFFQSQLIAQYKEVVINPIKDYFENFNDQSFSALEMSLAKPFWLPLKTYDQFEETDPLSSILATMAKIQNPQTLVTYQIILEPVSGSWQSSLIKKAETGGGKDENGKSLPHPDKEKMEEKVSQSGFKVNIRILSNNASSLSALAGSFGVYTSPSGSNRLTSKESGLFSKKKLIQSIKFRLSGNNQFTLNIKEIASLWHLPTGQITLSNISWGRVFRTEPPENLPVAQDLNKEEKADITFIGKTEFKNQISTFGIKKQDRSRHVYIVGKTGTGKSTLIANMAIEDIRKGSGVGIVDPHGDLIQIILNYIPKNRINDVCYFNPADPEYYFPLNPLEVKNTSQRELVASGIVSIFYKLYAESWGPRLEYILRNTLLTLTAIPDTTLADVIRILTDKKFRSKMVEKLSDKTMIDFWKNEFNRMQDRQLQEAIAPILNKVGQFVSSPIIRRVISEPESKVDLEEIMNKKKILLVDLSQGKIGEDNAALLGAMIITQIQLAAMNRVFMEESQRVPFYLFVDEFQNFATRSFIKILSEARKYKLNLAVANQYMAQLDEEIQDAILGNVGSLITFLVGAQDAEILEKEFGKDFTADDLVSLEKFQTLLKLSVDMQTSRPFFANTMPLPSCFNKNKEKIVRLSRERYGKKK